LLDGIEMVHVTAHANPWLRPGESVHWVDVDASLLTVQQTARTVELAAIGEFDLSNRDALHDGLVLPLDRGCRRLVLDLSGVTFMDAAAVGLLVAVREAYRDRGGVLVLANPSRPVRRILTLTNLDELLKAP